MKRITGILLMSIILFQVHAQDKPSRKELKAQQEAERVAEVKQLIESQEFIFEADRAVGNGGTMVTITADHYFFKMSNDSCEAMLPFYGRAYSTIDLNGDGGIRFDNKIEKLKTGKKERKKMFLFSGSTKNEYTTFDFSLDIFENGTASLVIRPGTRTAMTYYGEIQKIKD